MRIGIYLAYTPYRKTLSLRREGLGRYLSFLMKGFVETGNNIVIACPNWVVPAINELFEEEGVELNNVEIITPASEPIFYRIYYWLCNREKRKREPKRRLEKAMLKSIEQLIDILISTKNILTIFFIVFMIIVGFILLLPIFVVFIFLFSIFYFIGYIANKVLGIKFIYKGLIGSLLKDKNPMVKVVKYIRRYYSSDVVREKIRLSSTNEIIRKISNMLEPPEIWYCPTAFWKEFNTIKGIKVICVPDLVTTEFPGNFAKSNLTNITKCVSETIKEGTYFITYCEYLKKELLQKKFLKKKEDIVAIPHAQNDMLIALDLSNYFFKIPFKEDVNKYFARKIVLPGVIENIVDMHQYMFTQDFDKNFSIGDIDYIFYPSQLRGNKNIFNLVKAYEILLRKENIQVKLFLTCNYNFSSELKEYIIKNRLQYDILCFHDVSAQQLSALYMCAKLVVNPTFYEGGFPFTFGEGMSVGTPSIMSKIPQVMEVMEGYKLEDYIFDPYIVEDIVEKIKRGLQCRKELLNKELYLYEKLKKRTWRDVSREHLEAFEYFFGKDKL